MHLRRHPLSLLVPLVVAAACGSPRIDGDDSKPIVAVSVQPQAWFVNELAADEVEVAVIIPTRASHDAYQPTIEQLKTLSRAQLYIKVGHPAFAFETTWLRDLTADRPEIRIVDGSDGVDALVGDPHTWVSPRTARTMAANIAAALTDLLPDHATTIIARRDVLLSAIDALDEDLEAVFKDRRGGRFFVFHPAWGYLARDYGLHQVAIEHEGKEPNVETLTRLIEQARTAGVAVLFVQPQIATHGADVIAEEIGARLETLDPMAPDWLDNLRRIAPKLANGVVR